jgi:hypothetical protein
VLIARETWNVSSLVGLIGLFGIADGFADGDGEGDGEGDGRGDGEAPMMCAIAFSAASRTAGCAS